MWRIILLSFGGVAVVVVVVLVLTIAMLWIELRLLTAKFDEKTAIDVWFKRHRAVEGVLTLLFSFYFKAVEGKTLRKPVSAAKPPHQTKPRQGEVKPLNEDQIRRIQQAGLKWK